MTDFTTRFHALLGNIIELTTMLVDSGSVPGGPLPRPPPPPSQSVALPSVPRVVSMELIHKIGTHAGLNMDEYVGRVHTWEGIDFLTFKKCDAPRGKSDYTLNLKTRRPTKSSPNQAYLSVELERELVLE